MMIALLFALPLTFFWSQTLGGRTLLPTENLYQYEPFATYREVVRAPDIPHNALLSDLVLENYQWKSFILENIGEGEIPLWNPHQFAGIPFLAAGQQSTLYPLSLLYYVLPLPAAYGWFTVVNLWLAGVFMYAFTRGLGLTRAGALAAGIIYQLSAFLLTSAVFPMIIGAAVWLPLLLLMTEYIIQQKSALGRPSSVPWVAIGAAALGCNILAGHVELTYYTLIIVAYYAAARLAADWWKNWRADTDSGRPLLLRIVRRGAWIAAMIGLGFGLGAIQFIPLFELVRTNWRSESATLQDVLSWAHPLRDIVQFIMPNFYGNPSHHSYLDVFTGQTITQFANAAGQPITTIDWGIKNYVEGALYLGILPLALAGYALVDTWMRRHNATHDAPYRFIFALLGLASLTFMFGLPTYALLYYGFPGLNQSHTPFRWIYALTLCVGVLAGFGIDALAANSGNTARTKTLVQRTGWTLIAIGMVILAVLFLSRLFYDQVAPLIERIFTGMARASEAFSNAQMFYSYQFSNVLIFGLFTLGSGLVFRLAGRSPKPAVNDVVAAAQSRRPPLWQVFAIALIALDLMIATWGFNPASDPALLDFTPPAVEWLQEHLNKDGQWRYTTLDDPAHPPIMNANMGWRYALDDIRGYESIIPKQYVEYMAALAPQRQLDFNRIAPLYTTDLVPFGSSGPELVIPQTPLLQLLNVRYIVTHKSTELAAPGRSGIFWMPVYEDEAVRIRENPTAVPRAYLVPERVFSPDWLPASDGTFDYSKLAVPAEYTAAAITHDTGREKTIELTVSEPSWLVISESYFPGWRAFLRPQGGGNEDEKPLDVQLVLGNFQGVQLTETGNWMVRIVYSPASFNLGLFGSFISGVVIVFFVGVWLWRLFIVRDDQNASSVARIARNSAAPIILNLFNRGIDFGFAIVMLRILGPEGSGIYYYAAFIFGWFDIFTNFGLNTFLTREVARNRSQAWRYFFNTSILRLILMVVGAVLLAGFLFGRQTTISPPLSQEGVLAIILLYVGLLPNSLSTGMSALFYAFEKAEIPASISTISTISKAVFGVMALVLGYGVIGLAAVSIITNLITLGVMVYSGRDLMRSHGDITTPRRYRPDHKLIRSMVGESWPLMLNHFLATIFFQIDVVIIEAIHGARMVGQYSVAYKWVAALNVIPAFFTMALLPVMSRLAHEDHAAFKRSYRLAVKLLVSTALPVAVIFTFSAYFLTNILGGTEYLPDGAIATQLMIWSIPIGWMNSLTQYVLIALDLQRRITRAFFLAVTFNIVMNLIFVPEYGYRAAALITIASETALLIPFAVLLRNALGSIGWWDILWRPVTAAAVMLVILLVGESIQPVVSLLVAAAAYPLILLALRPFSAEETGWLRPMLPAKLRKIIPVSQ